MKPSSVQYITVFNTQEKFVFHIFINLWVHGYTNINLPTMMLTPKTAKIAKKTRNYPHLYSELPLLTRKLCSTILMLIKINFNQSGAGVSFSPRVGYLL